MAEYEASLNEYGFPRDEATSKDADPDNRKGKVRFVADSVIDWSKFAAAQHAESLPEGDPYSAARVVRVRRVDR